MRPVRFRIRTYHDRHCATGLMGMLRLRTLTQPHFDNIVIYLATFLFSSSSSNTSSPEPLISLLSPFIPALAECDSHSFEEGQSSISNPGPDQSGEAERV